jgi:hypothetical protein
MKHGLGGSGRAEQNDTECTRPSRFAVASGEPGTPGAAPLPCGAVDGIRGDSACVMWRVGVLGRGKPLRAGSGPGAGRRGRKPRGRQIRALGQAGGRRLAGSASKGPSGPDPTLSDEQLARLGARLEQGPAAAGYGEDQRWTLARMGGVDAFR